MFPTFIGILDIQSWWEVPSIAHFCSLFRAAFNLLDFDIEDLEEALLTDGGTEGRLLQELIVRLLEGCLPNDTRNDISTFNYQMFLRRLFRKKCQEYKCENPFNTDVDFELLPLRQKVEILRALCDFRLDAEDVECALTNLDSDSLRVEPLGHDSKNSAYWYFYGTRLYREDYISKEENSFIVPRSRGRPKDKKRKRRRSRAEQETEENEEKDEDSLACDLGFEKTRQTVWQVVCFTQQDWTRLVDKFRDSEFDTERKLYHTLAEDFLPEIPKLFELKEKQQRRRLLDRTNSRVLSHNQEPTEESIIMVRGKIKSKPSKSIKKSGQTSKGVDSDEDSPPPLISPPQKKGRQTNNSLASAVGQIVIHTRDELEGIPTKKGPGKNPPSTYVASYPYAFGIEEEERRVGMHKVLECIKDHADAWPFTNPVEEEYAPRYYSVVRKPMDLSTMEEKLEGGSYKNLNQFKRDFGLIIDNCRQYNGSDNEYTEMAMTLKEAFDRAIDRYLESEPSSDESPSVPVSPTVVTTPPYPLRTSSPSVASVNSRKRNKKSNKKSKSNKSEKKSKTKSSRTTTHADDGDEDDEDDNDDENDILDSRITRERRGKKKSKRCYKEASDDDEFFDENDEDDEGAISENAVIKSKRKKYDDVQLLPKNKRLSAKEERIDEKKSSSNVKKSQKDTLKTTKNHKESKKKKDDFEENHEPVTPIKNKNKRLSDKKGIESSPKVVEKSNKKSNKQRKHVESSDDEENNDSSDIKANGKDKIVEKVTRKNKNKKEREKEKGKEKEKIDQRITRSEDNKRKEKSPSREKKSKNKKSEELPKNGNVKNDENDRKKEDTASKKFDSLLSSKDLESLDSLKDRISERSRRDEKLKLEKLKKSTKTDGIQKKKVPSNGNTLPEKVNLKRTKLKKGLNDEKLPSKDPSESTDMKKSQKMNVKNSKSGRGESPAIQALNQATAQTLNDINKWLDDAPKLSEFSSGSDSPVLHPSTSEQLRTATKPELLRKRPNQMKLFGPNGPPRPKKVQRTIDRLQPGKSKGNLLINKKPNSNNSSSETTTNHPTADVDQSNRDTSDEPKLSLGTVLKNSDSIQLICKSLVSSPSANLSNEDEDDDRAAAPTTVNTEESTKEIVTPKTDTEIPKNTKESEEPVKPKSATPNLSAWFKAFGAPKSKKKEEEVEEIPAKKEEVSEVPQQRQRRHSAGGSSVSESVSSFSQESPPGLTGKSPQTQPAMTPTAIEQPVRAGFYQDALSTGSSPYNSPYYTTPPRYSAQLPPTPSPQNHPLSPAYPSSAAYDQNPLYPQVAPGSHQVYQKPSTPENPSETFNTYPQNSPGENFSQRQLTNSPKPSPVFSQPSPQPLPAYPQNSPQPPPSNYSQHSPQQPPTPNYSQPSPQQPAAANYSQPSPQQTPPNYSQPSPQQQHSPYSQPSPQPPPSYSQPSPQQPNSPYSQPSPKPPPTYSQVSPQTPSPYSQPSPQFTQPSPQPPPNYSQPSPQPPANYSQPSPQSLNFSQHSPQPPPAYTQPSPQSLNYSQPSPQAPNYPQHSPQQSTTSYTSQPSPQPRNYPQTAPQVAPCLPTPPRQPSNYPQASVRQSATSQVYVQSQKTAEDYPTTTPPTYPQGFKSNHVAYSGVSENERRVDYLKPEEKIQTEPPIALNSNHQVYQNQFAAPPYSNNFQVQERVCPPVTETQRPTSRLGTQESQQQPSDRTYEHADGLKYTQQRQEQSQLLTFQQNLPSHEGIYQPAGGFQAPPYPMPNPAHRPVYPSPHYYDASAKTTPTPPVTSTLAPVKKRTYNEPTGDTTRSSSQESRAGTQDQFTYDQMMALATSSDQIVAGQYDASFTSLADSTNPAYSRLGLGLVGRSSKEQQQLLSIPRPSSKDSLVYSRPNSSELDLNLLQSIQSASKGMPMQQGRREPPPQVNVPPVKAKKSRKKAAAAAAAAVAQQQAQVSSGLSDQVQTGMPSFPQYPGAPGDVVGLKNTSVVPPGGSAFNFASPAGAGTSPAFYDKEAAAAFVFLDEYRNPNGYYSILRQQQQQQQQQQQAQQQAQQQQQSTPVTEAAQQASKLNNQPPRNYPPHPSLHFTQRSGPYGPPVSPFVTPHTANLGLDPAAYQQYLHSLYALQPPTHHRPSWL